MREDIVSFVEDGGEPFFIEMAGVSYCDSSYRIERRRSNIYVFEYILQGSGEVRVGQQWFQPRKGDVYLLKRGEDHLYYADATDPWVKIWFNCRGPLIDALLPLYGLNDVAHIPGFPGEDVFDRMLKLLRECDQPRPVLFRRAALLFHDLVAELGECVKGGTYVSKAAQLRRRLDESVYDDISLDDLAGVIHHSVSQTIRLFRTEYGVTPYEYLLRRRVETAGLLLRNTNLPVREIALRLRFRDEHYFSGFFKRRMGFSPLAYRRGQGEAGEMGTRL